MDVGFIGSGNRGQPGAPANRRRMVLDQWELTKTGFGADSDFILIAQTIERRAGVTVGKKS